MAKQSEAESTTVYLTGHPLALLRSEQKAAKEQTGVQPSGSALAAVLISEAVAARNNARKKGAKS
jgi:hypothetical protein